jgi:SEC10/PgrA surface exclusion-like protein
MKIKGSIALLSTVTLLTFGSGIGVVHANSARVAQIAQLEKQRDEVAKKNGVTSYASDGRWYSLVELEDKVKELEASLTQLKTPYSEKNTIKVSPEYVKALKAYYNYKKSDSEQEQALSTLKAESKKLRYQEDNFVSNSVDQVGVYDVNNLPKEVKVELNYFALSMLNQVRKQAGLPQLTLSNSSIDFADKLSTKVREANRSAFDWHYVKGINDVAREYGLPTSSKADEEKEMGSQFYENSFSSSGVSSEMTKAEMKKWIYYSIVEFLYNGYEFAHAQSIVGVNYGKPSKNEYLGISLRYLKDGFSVSYITVSDEDLEKATKSNFSTSSPANTTESNRKALLTQKEKELKSVKTKYNSLNTSYSEYEKLDKQIDILKEQERKEKEELEKKEKEKQNKKNVAPAKPSQPTQKQDKQQDKPKPNTSAPKQDKPVASKNGWVKENGSWYYYNNGNRVTNACVSSYYLKSDGKMAENEWVYDPNYSSWFYLKSGGAYVNSAWYYDSYYRSWYYFKSGGYMAKNTWQGSYYLKSGGEMAKNEWIYDSYYNGWYYLKSNGTYAWSEWVQGRYWVDYSGRWI